jgi:hypothetical protein
MLKSTRNFELDATRFPKFVEYIRRMKEDSAVKETYITPDKHEAFYKSYASGEDPNYDLGLNSAA